MNHHPLHLDTHYAAGSTQFGQNVVVGNYVYSLLLGHVGAGRLGQGHRQTSRSRSLRHVAPTFHGDTIYGETTVLDKWESTSKDDGASCTSRRSATSRTAPWCASSAQGDGAQGQLPRGARRRAARRSSAARARQELARPDRRAARRLPGATGPPRPLRKHRVGHNSRDRIPVGCDTRCVAASSTAGAPAGGLSTGATATRTACWHARSLLPGRTTRGTGPALWGGLCPHTRPWLLGSPRPTCIGRCVLDSWSGCAGVPMSARPSCSRLPVTSAIGSGASRSPGPGRCDALSHHAALALLGLPLWGPRRPAHRHGDRHGPECPSRRGVAPPRRRVTVEPAADWPAACVSPARAVVRTALTMGQVCAVVAGDAALAQASRHPGRSDDRGCALSPHQGAAGPWKPFCS